MFNPAAEFAHLLPVVLSDGSLSMLQVASTAECVGRLAASEKITCRVLLACELSLEPLIQSESDQCFCCSVLESQGKAVVGGAQQWCLHSVRPEADGEEERRCADKPVQWRSCVRCGTSFTLHLEVRFSCPHVCSLGRVLGEHVRVHRGVRSAAAVERQQLRPTHSRVRHLRQEPATSLHQLRRRLLRSLHRPPPGLLHALRS